MKLTLLEAKTPIARTLNMTTADSRVTDYINEAQRVLLARGNWWGTIAKLEIVTTDGVVTWPRMVARVEAIAPCRNPIPIRNQWYEYLGDVGVNSLNTDCQFGCHKPQFYDHGEACLISDIVGTDKVLRVAFRDLTNDNAKKILFKGKDEDGETIYTQYPGGSGTYIEGEYVTCDGVSTYVNTTNYFSQVDSVLKDATIGFVDVYERELVAGTDRLVATYEPSETNITYRRSLIAPFESMGPLCTCTSCTSTSKTITALVKRVFIPAAADTDYLLIGNLQALKLAVQSLRKFEDNLPAEGDMYMNGTINPLTKSRQGGAIGELQAEQKLMEGRVTTSIVMRAHGSSPLYKSRIGMK